MATTNAQLIWVIVLCTIGPAFGANAEQGRLAQEAYVWQRVWSEPVREAVAKYGTNFSGLTALAAEVSWKQGEAEVVRVRVDYALAREARCPVGLALRVGPYTRSFETNGSIINALAGLAASLVREAEAEHLKVRELQIDFDCAESKLDGYRLWVQAIRQRVAPVPVVITALPSWLNQKAFERLASSVDGYVLQVHSLERPRGPDARFTICDPPTAKLAVEKAARIGVAFRVALPTYGYVVAFGPSGRLVGLSAEGPRKEWPEGTRLREVRAEPGALAGLVGEWMTNRPAALNGIIWYRLPNSLDILNWPWPTLSAVMAGRPPRESARVETSRPEAGLTEIKLLNDGDADLSSRPVVEVRWQHARLVASDGLRGFEVVDPGPDTLELRAHTNSNSNLSFGRLAPGERRVIGWVRLDREAEVQVEIKK